MKTIIQNGHVIDPKNNIDAVLDICIERGVITQIGTDLPTDDATILNARGLTVTPGLIDMHCHLREPGYEYKEDIASGTKSAAAGGFTTVACMPNTEPVADSGAVIALILKRAKEAGFSNVCPIGAISKGLLGEQLAEMGDLAASGAVAVSDDGKPVENPSLMRRALIYANMLHLPVISHCEEKALLDGGVMNEGFVATTLGLRGISNAVEETMVSRDILIAEAEGVPVHIAHVSTKGSVELVRRAKERGVAVTCETCPHYFSLTEEDVRGYNTNAKMNPPLRTPDDVRAICEGLADGTIDAIATDHAPHHEDEKLCEFDRAANGIIGFETALPLGITCLVREGVLTLPQLIEKMTVNPARILHLDCGTIMVGQKADLTLFRADEKIEITKENIHSKSKNTPYIGRKLYGRVYCTIINGGVHKWV